MVFEIVNKMQGCKKLDPCVMSVKKTSITLGREIAESFIEDPRVEIYLDQDEKRVGLKPTSDMVTGFGLSKTSPHSLRTNMSSTHILKVLEIGRYNAVLEDGMWVISEALKIE